MTTFFNGNRTYGRGRYFMYKINFEQPVHVHFIGIGGISMSGLAEILLKEGFAISGSDNKESALTSHLKQQGATMARKRPILLTGLMWSCIPLPSMGTTRNTPRRLKRGCLCLAGRNFWDS